MSKRKKIADGIYVQYDGSLLIDFMNEHGSNHGNFWRSIFLTEEAMNKLLDCVNEYRSQQNGN